MNKYIWKHRDKQWIKENPGQPTMYKEYLTKDETKVNEVKKNLQHIENTTNTRKKYENKDKSGAGIYIVMCEESKRVYVGQSISMDTRLRSHKLMIKSNRITNSKPHLIMREDSKKHGLKSFKFIKYKFMPESKEADLLKEEALTMVYFMKEGYTLYNTSKPTNIYCDEEIKPIITKLLYKISKNPELIKQIQTLID